ncbi:type I restriction-modification system subunit M [Thiorhodovibrio frisius]|uniref:site-specific DNA-methyltransferase (adenine-specific) n=1 Tax=Thiorhodovibrio frisius TaxID=631362 RepID=H8Z0P2_9GAMM|nr:class I SAM-dependent DNA methyltransferase [Thiorhodovibrio frisius]EIC22383.1 type I restriction-modification system methyltransferase subunit [Thiorhodovibrio frisius]WPL24681.1 putative type I restriction enzymeP M protein [Thiorhodovibrio frisius]
MPKLSLAKLERHLLSAADRLRQEGLDAATYKDYIFGMLFLKRCSDQYDAERERIVNRKIAQGIVQDIAEERYGENPDYYDTFFVPERARWSYLQSKLNDASKPFGSRLDEALAALTEHNDSLTHVLDHIQFQRMQGNKRVVSDDACADLVRHFSKHRLRNEDFQFSDLLGSAYEYLINMFAESAGKKGGDFYTPRDLIRLMVRILKPAAGMRVYDPTCGSGGMLIISREYVEQSGGDPRDLVLAGQVNDASAWSICKLNMLLHGVEGADIQLEDTLLHPQHREAGELERFDRVIANPPFSQNYSRTNMEYPERFRWGWCPTTGKKADLMFAQHMLAVCRPQGMVATVMPHGVLFRAGAEREIRQKLLQQDLIEAVIGLPPNLFYGAAIPACILVMRPNLSGQPENPNKPEGRRGRVLFINADAEYHAGRAQNALRPEDIEKIVTTYKRFEDLPAYARVVSIAEIGDPSNDWNLNIRRYVDNAPPPEPQDVRAHLHGGVPATEIDAQRALFDAIGLDPSKLFVCRDARYPAAKTADSGRLPPPPSETAEPITAARQLELGLGQGAYRDFAPTLTERAAIRPLIEQDPGVQARLQTVQEQLASWWREHAPKLSALSERGNLNAVRAEMLASFADALAPLAVLDYFKLAGVVAAWWTDSLADLKTLMERGFAGVIDGWIDAIADALDDEDNTGPAFDPFSHKLVLATMGDYLERIAETRAEVARLKADKAAFEADNAPEDLEEEELNNWNQAKDLERQAKELRAEHHEPLKAIGKLATQIGRLKTQLEQPVADNARARTAARKREEQLREAEARHGALETQLAPVHAELQRINAALAPYQQTLDDLANARKRYRALLADFLEELKSRCGAMSEDVKEELVLALFAKDLQAGLDAALAERRAAAVGFAEKTWNKYRVTLTNLREDRARIEERINSVLEQLDYT